MNQPTGNAHASADALDLVRFDDSGLVPAVVQDAMDGQVLMVAYMNRESLRRTLESGLTCFWSRSRQEYWVKGLTSGNTQKVVSLSVDCDEDCLLIVVEQQGKGVACHTGKRTCFFRQVDPVKRTLHELDASTPHFLLGKS